MIIWILFSIVTFYLTGVNYYYDTTIMYYLPNIYGKIIRLFLTIIISFGYSIFGPMGFICLLTLKYDNFIIKKDKIIKLF